MSRIKVTKIHYSRREGVNMGEFTVLTPEFGAEATIEDGCSVEDATKELAKLVNAQWEVMVRKQVKDVIARRPNERDQETQDTVEEVVDHFWREGRKGKPI